MVPCKKNYPAHWECSYRLPAHLGPWTIQSNPCLPQCRKRSSASSVETSRERDLPASEAFPSNVSAETLLQSVKWRYLPESVSSFCWSIRRNCQDFSNTHNYCSFYRIRENRYSRVVLYVVIHFEFADVPHRLRIRQFFIYLNDRRFQWLKLTVGSGS